MQGKVRAYDEVLCFPAAQDAPKEAHFSLALSRVVSCELNERQEEAEGAAHSILRGHYMQADPTNHIMDSMKKPANTSLETFSGHPLCSMCLNHTLLHPVGGSMCLLLKAVRASSGRWILSMCRKPVRVCGPGRDHK